VSLAARLGALLALELDPVRRRERVLDLRLAAAVALSPRLEVCEGLLAGVAVPARRLDARLVAELGLGGDVLLDEELALRVVALGPLEEADDGR
jgi:hypothetical protein